MADVIVAIFMICVWIKKIALLNVRIIIIIVSVVVIYNFLFFFFLLIIIIIVDVIVVVVVIVDVIVVVVIIMMMLRGRILKYFNTWFLKICIKVVESEEV